MIAGRPMRIASHPTAGILSWISVWRPYSWHCHATKAWAHDYSASSMAWAEIRFYAPLWGKFFVGSNTTSRMKQPWNRVNTLFWFKYEYFILAGLVSAWSQLANANCPNWQVGFVLTKIEFSSLRLIWLVIWTFPNEIKFQNEAIRRRCFCSIGELKQS